MPGWMKKVRGAIGMGVVWAVAWAVIGGGLMEGIFDRDGRMVDMWPQLLGIVGFLGGVMFSGILGFAAGRRRFDELSVPQFTAYGALGGAVLGGFGLFAGGPAVFVAVATLGCAAAAAGTLVVARKAEGRRTLRAGDVTTELDGGDARDRIGHGE